MTYTMKRHTDKHAYMRGMGGVKTLLVMLLMMVVGVNGVKAQTVDYSGTYFIAYYGFGSGYYNDSNPANNYYWCPVECKTGTWEGWFDFYPDDDTDNDTKTDTYSKTDTKMDFLTTYKCRDGVYESRNAQWIITKHETLDAYYIQHKKSSKYLTMNGSMKNAGSTNRLRVHLQEDIAPNNKSLFEIVKHEVKTYGTSYVIKPYSQNQYINVSGLSTNSDTGNYNELYGTNGKTDGPKGLLNVGGTLGWYSDINDKNGQWFLEDYIKRPTIGFDNSDNNKIVITNETTSSSGMIYYTTNGDDPTLETSERTSFDVASKTIESFTDNTVIKAVAKVGNEYSNVVTFNAYMHIGSGHEYLMQTKDGGSFYMVPPITPITTETNVTTTNIPHEKMAWYLTDAGQTFGYQYYYIVNKNTGQYLYCSGAKAADNAFVMKAANADGTVSTRYRFMLVASGGGYNIIPEIYASEATGMCMSKKNGNNATDYLNLSNGTDDYSRWMFIARPDNPKTLFDNSFASSSTDSKYYKIQNANSTHNIIPPTTAGGNATTKDNATGDNTMWYFVPTADGDSWVEYYNIRNGLTGEYLYFNGTAGGNNTVFTSSSIITGNENQYKFIVVKGASSDYPNAYNIIPYALKDQANQANNSLNRNGTALRTQNSRNTPASLWNLVDGDYTVAPPVITYDPFTNKATITCTTPGATISYTTDGTEPTSASENNGTTPVSFELTEIVATIRARAIAQKGGATSTVATQACIKQGADNAVLLQSVDCEDFYMTVGDLSGTNTTVNTSSLPQAGMSWHFEDAGTANGIQYYYIYNTFSEAFLQRNGDNLYLTAKQETDAFKFNIVPYFDNGTLAGYNIHSKAVDKYVHKSNGNGAANVVYLNANAYEERSRWNIIALSEKDFTLPFATSDNTSATYYTFASSAATDYFITTPSGTVVNVTTSNGTSDSQKWYFKEAGNDGWATYYYILNAVTGEAMCFNKEAKIDNQTDALVMNALPDVPDDNYKFTLAKTTVNGEYYIIPKPLAQYAKTSYAAVWRENTGTLQTRYNRADSKIKWKVTEAENYVAPPVITYDPYTNKATITCTTPGATISYTTDGTNASTDASYSDVPFLLNEGATTITATAQKGNDSSNSTTITITFQTTVGEENLRPYLIQSKQCQFYNLIPNTSIDETTKYVSTLNVPCETMAWHFEYAEEGYYYVVDKNGWYLYYTTTDNSNNYVYLKSSKDESDDGFKFSITAHASGGFNLIPKGPTKSINKSNYGGSNAGLTPAKIAGNIGDANSRWDIIPYSTTNLTQWATAPFENISDDSHTYYYKIVSVSQSTKPIILNNDGDVKSQVPPTGIDERKTMWVIKEAVTDGLLHYYTFQNAYTGELLYYNGNGRNKTTNSFQLGQPEVEGANAQWSYFVIVQTENGYNIIPKVIVDKTKDETSKAGYNCINRAGGNDVLGTYYDDGNGSRWTFSPVEAAVKCMDPVFGEDAEGNITITSTTNAAKIRYTENGEDPTTESDVYTTLLPASQKKCIKAIAIIGEDAGSMSEVVTLLNCPDIDLDVDNYVYNKTAKEPAVKKVYIGDVVATAGTYSAPVYTNNTNAGTEIVKPTVTITDAVADDRLVIANAKKEFVIQPLEVTLNWANTTLTYNRSAQTPTATVTNCIEGDECNVTVAVEEETSHTDVGDYTAIAQSLDNTNYALPTENTMAFSIIRKSIGDGTSLAAGFIVTMGDGDNPTFTVKDGTVELQAGMEYEVSDPVTEDGNQVWTISGIGNYTGSTKLMRIALTFNETGEESGHQEHDVTPYQASADMTIGGLDAYKVTHVNMTKRIVTIKKINYVKKDEPLLLLTDLAGTELNYVGTATPLYVAEGDVADTSDNLLQVSPEGGKPVAFGEVYMYYEGKFVMTTGGTLAEGKFYLDNPNPPSSSGGGGTSNAPLRIVIDDTTDMEDVKTMMEDEREGPWYTLDGRRLNGKPNGKGLYLKEGKKIVIK